MISHLFPSKLRLPTTGGIANNRRVGWQTAAVSKGVGYRGAGRRAELLWSASLALLTIAIWFDPAAGPPESVWIGTLAGLVLLPIAASVSQLVIALHRGLVVNLLCTSESRELRRQVATLRESRSAVIDVEASELHRIERDLHDGAQQRLVMLNIDLGMAAERVEADPVAAKALILEGQAQARGGAPRAGRVSRS